MQGKSAPQKAKGARKEHFQAARAETEATAALSARENPGTRSMAAGGGAKVPRNFKLLAELEEAEKDGGAGLPRDHAGMISYGLADDADLQTLSSWNATIIGPQGSQLGERFYSLTVFCDENYPDRPPTVRFVNRIAGMPSVNANGVVSGLDLFRQWNGQRHKIIDVLIAIREQMPAAARVAQPPEGSTY